MNLKKANLNNWYNTPPRIIQNLGDALSAVSMFALGYAAIEGAHVMAIIFIIVGCAGIFLKKLFRDE